MKTKKKIIKKRPETKDPVPSLANDHKVKTPRTEGKEADDRKFTSYDTTNPETATPQKVREAKESSKEMESGRKAG